MISVKAACKNPLRNSVNMCLPRRLSFLADFQQKCCQLRYQSVEFSSKDHMLKENVKLFLNKKNLVKQITNQICMKHINPSTMAVYPIFYCKIDQILLKLISTLFGPLYICVLRANWALLIDQAIGCYIRIRIFAFCLSATIGFCSAYPFIFFFFFIFLARGALRKQIDRILGLCDFVVVATVHAQTHSHCH